MSLRKTRQFPGWRNTYGRYEYRISSSSLNIEVSDLRFAPSRLDWPLEESAEERVRSQIQVRLDRDGARSEIAFRDRGKPSRIAKLHSGSSAVHRWTTDY